MPDQAPEQRAQAAAEALAAEGLAVTTRAVRQRAGVSQAVASATTREWAERAAEAQAAPPVPEAVVARFDAIWREAYLAARAEFDAERVGWQERIAKAETDLVAANEDVDTIAAQRDEAVSKGQAAQERAATLRSELEAANAALGTEREAARVAERAQASAEARASAAEGLVAGLREALAAVRRDAGQ